MSRTEHFNDDEDLLAAWVKRRDQKAFRTLAEKYSGLVYAAALRKSGRQDWAEDVVQEVFTVFARRCSGLRGAGGLAGWFHRTSVLITRTRLRTEFRREARLKRLAALSPRLSSADTPPERDWGLLRPVLDDAIAALPRKDREIILLRYFEGKSFAEISALTALTPEAATKRSQRALVKLCALLKRKGASLPVTALGALLSSAFRESAPAAMTGFAAQAGMAGTAGVTIPFLFSFMSAMKVTVIAASLIAAGSLACVFWPPSPKQTTITVIPASGPPVDTVALEPVNTGSLSAGKRIAVNPVLKASLLTPFPVQRAPRGPDPDPGVKEAFLAHPRTKKAEARMKAFQGGFKRLLDRSAPGIGALNKQLEEAKRRSGDATLSESERSAARAGADKVSERLKERMEEQRKFREEAETWLTTEVLIERDSILEEIKNSAGLPAPAPASDTPEDGTLVISSAVFQKANDLLKTENYAEALAAFSDMARESSGLTRDYAYWNAMLCAMVTGANEDAEKLATTLVRNSSPSAACFALAAKAIQRNDWGEAQLWVDQAVESGNSPTEISIFRDGLARLGWMEPNDNWLIPPTSKNSP